MFEDLQYKAYRKTVLERGVRADGRDAKTLRPITCEVGVLPRVHGSAIFERGDTQAPGHHHPRPDQGGPGHGRPHRRRATSKSFILHYNFPPFSVGETGRFTGPGRREIGHGALAERSLVPVASARGRVPLLHPRRLRDHGLQRLDLDGLDLRRLPLAHGRRRARSSRPVAGISCGLMTENDADGSITKWVTITDILGEEDHFGDMDFKLAGTTKGITGFQLDLKINGLPIEIAKAAIFQARDARIEILRKMLAAMPAPRARPQQVRAAHPDDPDRPREDRPAHRPRRQDHPPHHRDHRRADRHRRGRLRQGLHLLQQRRRHGPRRPGDRRHLRRRRRRSRWARLYHGSVTGIKEFGASSSALPGKEGLVHISELADFRVRRTEDVVKMGDMIWVKCIGIDDRTGKVRLSRRAAMKERETAQPASPEAANTPAPQA